MTFKSRLIWVWIEDLPKMINAKIIFCCGYPGYDPAYVSVQLYDNERIEELDHAGVDWKYPEPDPGHRGRL